MKPEEHDIIVIATIPDSVYLEAAQEDAKRLLGLCDFCGQPVGAGADTTCRNCIQEQYGE